MMENLLINQTLIERYLAGVWMFDKICSDEEWETIANFVQFLKILKTASEVLSGSKYPTISLVLLFRVEIVASLHDLSTDCAMEMSMKQRMRQAVNHQLPRTELNVAAALLDPSKRNLIVVQDFLIAQETTAVHLLSQVVDKYTGGLQESDDTIEIKYEAANNGPTISLHACMQFHGKGPNYRPAVKTRPFYSHRWYETRPIAYRSLNHHLTILTSNMITDAAEHLRTTYTADFAGRRAAADKMMSAQGSTYNTCMSSNWKQSAATPQSAADVYAVILYLDRPP
jgi:hypothetical protein